MDRRGFLSVAAATAAAATLSGMRPLAAHGAPEQAPPASDPVPPGTAASGTAASGTAASGSALPAFALSEVTLAELAEGLDTGRWTCRSLVEEYLAVIEQLDRRGPALNTILETQSGRPRDRRRARR